MNFDGTGKTLCITGAGGFLGCNVVKAALAANFKVHATCRSIEKLKPGVKSALEGVEWFEADLVVGPEGFEKAFAGCDYVLHTAAPFFFEVEDVQKELLDPMVKGFENVWEAAKKTGVKKIVYTCSVACIQGAVVPAEYNEICGGGKVDESRWNIMSSATNADKYEYSKTMAERNAWVTYFGRNPETDPELVVLNPGIMMGPPVAPETAGSSTSMQLAIGAYSGAFATPDVTPPFKIGPVDVRQVAQAHVSALAPHCKGRYILCHEKAMDIGEIFATVDAEYPDNKFPKDVAQISARLEYDHAKAKKDLGIEFYPLSKTMKDTIEGLKGFGIIQ